MHAIGWREVGWDDVRPTLEQIAAIASGGQVALTDQLLSVAEDVACDVESSEVRSLWPDGRSLSTTFVNEYPWPSGPGGEDRP